MISDFGDEFMPRRATTGSCGYDIYYPGEDVMVYADSVYGTRPFSFDTGVHLEQGDIPYKSYATILPRSSVGFKYGLRFCNTMPIIDSDYRDSIKLSFTVDRDMELHKGDRIGQMIINYYAIIGGEIPPTAKRNGGIGSTGQ